ncbi:type II toxin-antitoxin system YafQ family toxin [Thiomicrorhabdus sp. 6S2-11]|uniref:Type II toxin-antitoxin system YafQ family toxin n=1 Tax=Thiomicrorhabdus marina TaxID=2818442 RepID=A0ABS3Q4I8_9GAMM|nr:type II toxin-antitoxin system YafQ family toxin [Thiomicrorhabdus marina]MBO1927236.1 type II toxin-antitoxin system YafQ family toxin [Thiomicrorhabdus marina]
MLEIEISSQFKKDFKKLQKKSVQDVLAVGNLVGQLQRQEALAEVYRDHALVGNWHEFRDCHVKPDLVLIYRIHNQTLQLARIGSHSELF